MSPIGPRRTATVPTTATFGSTCTSLFTCESVVLLGNKKLAIFIRYLRRLACTGPRLQVYLHLFGAIWVESSDGKVCYERVTSRIHGNCAKPLRRRLRNSSLCSCYVVVATIFAAFTWALDCMATNSRSAAIDF